MHKFINYLIRFGIVSIISVLLEIYVEGPELFFNNIVRSVLTILMYYFISYFIFNIINSTCFYIFGRLQSLNAAFLNYYPLFIRRNTFYVSFNILNVFKTLNTYELFEEDIADYKQRVNKSINSQTIFKIVIAIFLLLMGVYFKISLFNFVFSIICLYFIINDYFASSQYLTSNKNDSLVFEELIFSTKIGESILQYHIEYLQENSEGLLSKPVLLDDLLKLVFSLYNLDYDTSNYILKLDNVIENLLTYPAESIDIACRGLIFEYIDNRICLSVVTKESIGDIKKLLNMYISKSWDINIPQSYLNRYNTLIGYLNDSNQDIKFRTGYLLWYFNKYK